MSAIELYNAYKSNGVAADSTYKDKVILITGVIDSVGKDIADTPYISLGSGLMVQCMFDDANAAPLSELQPGQNVTIKGTCDGFLIEVVVRDCTLQE